jgi:hypothetical protein
LAGLNLHLLSDIIGADRIYDTLREALAAIHGHRIEPVSIPNPAAKK